MLKVCLNKEWGLIYQNLSWGPEMAMMKYPVDDGPCHLLLFPGPSNRMRESTLTQ